MRGYATMIKILFICHGNICRSTMAESVLTHLVHQLHLDNQFEIDSAATSREEIGNPPHYGTKNKLYEENIPLVPHRARQQNTFRMKQCNAAINKILGFTVCKSPSMFHTSETNFIRT